jgi:hypothetical protein
MSKKRGPHLPYASILLPLFLYSTLTAGDSYSEEQGSDSYYENIDSYNPENYRLPRYTIPLTEIERSYGSIRKKTAEYNETRKRRTVERKVLHYYNIAKRLEAQGRYNEAIVFYKKIKFESGLSSRFRAYLRKNGMLENDYKWSDYEFYYKNLPIFQSSNDEAFYPLIDKIKLQVDRLKKDIGPNNNNEEVVK